LKVVIPEEMRELDFRAMSEFQISEEILMERAGISVARAGLGLLGKDRPRQEGKNPLSVSGGGHNGADSLVALRDLVSRGMNGTAILMETDPARQSEAVHRELARLRALSVPILSCEDKGARHRIMHAGLIMDGLLGTGFRGELSDRHARVIAEINRAGDAGVPVVSVDIPSGVDGLTGHVPTIAVKARMTVTFGAPKWGLLVDPGTRYAGSVWVSPIGFPRQLLAGGNRFCLTPVEAVGRLSKRFPAMHKGRAGHVLILGGSPGKTGAVLLSARGALRMGAGLVTVLWSERFLGQAAGLPEVMGTYYSPSDADSARQSLLSAISGKTAVACGPGLEEDDVSRTVLESLIREYPGPLVADAGVFSFFADKADELARLRCGPLILTPHPGELARLMGTSIESVLKDPTLAAQEASLRTSAIVLLKGARTIVADPGGSLYVNMTGTPLMAGPGMGDVLTGMLVSLIGQGQDPFEAACLAAYLHGAVGNRRSDKGPSRGFLASELADGIPELLALWEHDFHPLLSTSDDPVYLWPTGGL
jgi:NAD(P)H-hydrate epimerase